MEGHKGGVSNFGEILDAVVERATGALRRADGNPETYGAGESVENAEDSLRLVAGAVLVDGYKNVVITKKCRHAEKGGKDVRNDVEGVVKVDGKEVLVFAAGEVAPVIVVRCLFLARAGNWVKTAKTQIKEPRFGWRGVVADEGGVALAGLLHIQGVKILCTLAGVVG